jgi:hypothetical protein
LVRKGNPTRGSHKSVIKRVRGMVWFSWAKIGARVGPAGRHMKRIWALV